MAGIREEVSYGVTATEALADAMETVSVLLVEDSPDDAALISTLLRSAAPGYDISQVTTLMEARSRLAERRPACMLVDLRLPDAREFDTVNQLTAAAPDVAMVVMTHLDDRGVAAIRHGADDFLLKDTMTSDALVRAIRYSIERRRLRRANDELAAIVEWSDDAMFAKGLDGVITSWNRGAERLYGWSAAEAIGTHIRLIVPTDRLEEVEGIMSMARRGRVLRQYDTVRRRKDGTLIDVSISCAPIRGGAGEITGCAVVARDISDRRTAEEDRARYARELEHRALHDELTALPNRTLLHDRIQQAQERCTRAGSALAVLFVDLDHFKEINDTLGHAIGDAVLTAVAERLATTLRSSDTLARFGGDEFVVVTEGLTGDNEITAVANRLSACFEAPFPIGANEFFLSASIGVAVWQKGQSPDDLIRDADSAMYRAKDRGRARVELFDDTLRAGATERLRMHLALRRAVLNDELAVHYQPIVQLCDGAPAGVEALVRWHDAKRGAVPPADFIPLAEDTGLIVRIGERVARQALEDLVRWRRDVPAARDLWVTVNLSARQLTVPGIADDVARMIAEAGVEPDALCLEITETAVMSDVERSVQTLSELRAVGVRLAIDDFGTGYSSLSYLKRLPLDTVKIDRSFVDGLGTDADDSSIVNAVLGLGKALGLRVLGEGVETARQRAELDRLGCELAQGFYFSRPLPADGIAAWLAAAGASA